MPPGLAKLLQEICCFHANFPRTIRNSKTHHDRDLQYQKKVNKIVPQPSMVLQKKHNFKNKGIQDTEINPIKKQITSKPQHDFNLIYY